jgi:hypothetical protein
LPFASQGTVTPVKTGVQISLRLQKYWIPAFAGMTEKGLGEAHLELQASSHSLSFFCPFK